MEKREKSSKIVVFIVFIPFFIFFLLQILAPLALPPGSVKDLTGQTVISDSEDIINKMPQPWNFIYSAGDRLCHQKSERSFFLNDNQMPFCARCTAIFLGFAIGIGSMMFYKIKLNLRFILLIMISLAPIGIDGVGQILGMWESNNITRTITGLLIGIVTGFAITIIIDELSEMYFAKKNRKLINE